MRTVIFGNSGSGKSWLARRLGEKRSTPVVHLDEIFWLPGGFNAKRDPAKDQVDTPRILPCSSHSKGSVSGCARHLRLWSTSMSPNLCVI